MIIHDLEHLKCISDNNLKSAYIVEGAGKTLAPPIIDLSAYVKASSFPSSLYQGFDGYVKASQTSIMKVYSKVFVRAISAL